MPNFSPQSAFFLLLLALSACDSSGPGASGVDPSEYINVAQVMLRSAQNGNHTYVDNKVDWNELVDRMIGDLHMEKGEREKLVRGIGANAQLGMLFTNLGGEPVESSLLQLRYVGNEPRVIVRMLLGSESVTYCEILMGYNRRLKEVLVRDIYLYAAGAWLSDLLRGTLVYRFSDQEELLDVKVADTMSRMIERDLNQVIPMYHRLPGSLKQTKPILFAYMKAGRTLVDTNEYARAVDLFARTFPDEVGSRYLLMRRHLELNEPHKAITAIASLDSIVDDPYLKYLRGMMYAATSDSAAAKRWIRSAIRSEPGLRAPYWPLIDLHLHDGEYREAVSYLDKWSARFRMPADSVESIMRERGYAGIDYDPLMRSLEYKRWRRDVGF